MPPVVLPDAPLAPSALRRTGEYANIARLLPCVGAVGIEIGKLRRADNSELRPGLCEPDRGHLHVQVFARNAPFQRGELGDP